jgi:DNA-binding MarR family transcriptional regulator
VTEERYLVWLMAADRVTRLVADVTRLQPDIDEGTKSLGARLLHLSDLVERHYGAVCDQFGVSLSGHSVLTTLRRHAPRELTLTEINLDALVTSGGMTFVARQLEKQGLVARRPNPDDRRSSLLRLTSEGRRVADRVIAAVAEADSAIAAHIGRNERRAALKILTDLQGGLESVMQKPSYD